MTTLASTQTVHDEDAELEAALSADETPRERRLSNAAVIGYVLRQWARRPLLGLGMMAGTFAGTLSEAMLPVATGLLIAGLAEADARVSPEAAFGLFVALSLGALAGRQLMARCEIRFSSANMRELTADGFAQVQRFSSDWHANTFAGATVRKISRGMWSYDMVTATLTFGLAPTLIMLTVLPGLMVARFPIVGLYAVTVVLLYVSVSIWAARYYIKPANVISNARDSAIGAALADSLGANAVVKAFGAEERENARFRTVMARWRAAALRTWSRYVNMGLVQSVTALALSTGLIGLLLLEWRAGRAGPGDVAFGVSAFLIMSGYLRRFGEEVQQCQRALDELEDLAQFERAEPDVADRAHAPEFVPGPGRITFEGVGFGYANQGGRLYDDFSLEIAPGEKVALVGPTGSGKSTFVKLLQRLYDVDEGVIRIDGQDIAGVTQSSLRRAIALVPQDPALFHRSIAANVAYARPGATMAQIEDATRRAHAHDFVERLPEGYATLVGERGVKLSGGERQRIAIARALLADAPILVMDEATSSLDNATEALVQAAMEELLVGRTAILIAHRLSTVRRADRILVFDRGRIVEQGTHERLVALGGVYAGLHAAADGPLAAPAPTLKDEPEPA